MLSFKSVPNHSNSNNRRQCRRDSLVRAKDPNKRAVQVVVCSDCDDENDAMVRLKTTKTTATTTTMSNRAEEKCNDDVAQSVWHNRRNKRSILVCLTAIFRSDQRLWVRWLLCKVCLCLFRCQVPSCRWRSCCCCYCCCCYYYSLGLTTHHSH